MKNLHERNIYQFLSGYRFLSFVLAVVLIQVLPLKTGVDPPLKTYVTLAAVGIYSLYKVFYPLRWHDKHVLTTFVLAVDILVSIALLLSTTGLSSGYLLYSITPVITAVLVLKERTAITSVAIISATVVFAHVGLSHWYDRFVWVMEGNYLLLLILFIGFMVLLTTLAYQVNLNIGRRIEVEAVLEERKRIRQEMHDGIAQSLSYLGLKTNLLAEAISSQQKEKALAQLGEIRKTVHDSYSSVRESMDQLGADVKEFPLMPAISDLIRDFSRKNGIQVQFDAPRYLQRLSPPVELQLLRIVQESLVNVAKHAGATRVWVKLTNTPRGVEVSVKDNGQGFVPGAARQDSRGHHGLKIMKERAEGRGGILEIITALGKGTEIRAGFPWEKVRT